MSDYARTKDIPYTMKCAVITPIGPGHTELYVEARLSIEAAFQENPGKFDTLEIIAVDDALGECGRSSARNEGTARAVAKHCDWIFFLDADDVMMLNAFSDVAQYVDEYDAVWGLIYECSPGSDQVSMRLPQLPSITSLDELVLYDPYTTLQMGHFVKSDIALNNPFDNTMDTGEDFRYYLDVWRSSRCIKQPRGFFVNRRGRQSTGPRSADGRQWREAVGLLLVTQRKTLTDEGRLTNGKEIQNAKSMEVANLVKANADTNIEQCLELANQYPINGVIDIRLEDHSLSFYCENDDVTLLTHLWQRHDHLIQLVASANQLGASGGVYTVGSYTGVVPIFLSVVTRAEVAVFEPSSWAYTRLQKNAHLNEVRDNLHCFNAIPAGHSETVDWNAQQQAHNMPMQITASSELNSGKVSLRYVDIVSQISDGNLPPPRLIILHRGMPSAFILMSLKPLLEQYEPDIFIEVESANGLAAGIFLDVIFPDGHSYEVLKVDLHSGEVDPAAGVSSTAEARWFLLRTPPGPEA